MTFCAHDHIEPRIGTGRKLAYRHISDLSVPDDLALPTCTSCNNMFLDRFSAHAFDVAMQPVYKRALVKKAKEALDILKQAGVQSRDIGPWLGLPTSCLIALKDDNKPVKLLETQPLTIDDSECALDTAQVAALMLLALRETKTHVEDLRRMWSASTRLNDIIVNNYNKNREQEQTREHLVARLKRLDERLDYLASLKDGWLDGAGLAPSTCITQVREYFHKILTTSDVPPPHLYPTEDGGISAEWTVYDWDTSAVFDPTGNSAELHTLNVKTDQEARYQWSADAPEAYNMFVAFISRYTTLPPGSP